MLSSSRDQQPSLSRSVCIAFLEEYLVHRSILWGSYIHWGNKQAQERKTTCDTFIERIKSATSVADRESLIKDLGIAARKAQSEKWQSKSNSFFNMVADTFLNLFTKDNSLFAKTCHAARTRMVADMLLSQTDSDLHSAEINKLRIQLEEKSKLIDDYYDRLIDTSKLQEERDAIYYQLLDMHDKETIKHAAKFKDKLFPPSLPTYELNQIRLPQNLCLKPNPNVPLVYDVNYSVIFHENDIKVDPQREHDFNQQLKNVSKDQSLTSNILSSSYFFPINVESQIIPNRKEEVDSLGEENAFDQLLSPKPDPKLPSQENVTSHSSTMFPPKKEEAKKEKKKEHHHKLSNG